MKTSVHKPGIQGYAPKGAVGDKGESGYSLHYTSYSMENDMMIVDDLVTNNKPLSNKINEDVYVQYNENDTIIDKYAMMYTMKLNTDPSVNMTYTYTYIGNIINQTENENASTKITIDDNVGLTISNAKVIKINNYTQENENSPLHRHKDENHNSHGLHLALNTTLKDFIKDNNKNVFKIVILHKCGLSQEWIIDARDVDDIDNYLNDYVFFVEFRMLQMSTESSTISTTLPDITSNILNDKCVCYTDIELPNYGTYRKKLCISDE
jgi:hypothetical protein